MLDLLVQYPLLDLSVYGILLYAFHWCVFRSPYACAVISIIALGKVFHTSSGDSGSFWVGLNLALFACLWLGLFFTRKSPNYFWLFSGLLVIKFIDVSLHQWIRQQGAWFYAWMIIADILALILIDQRSNIVKWIARKGSGEAQRWAQAAEPYQDLAYQDLLLILLYWVVIIINLLTMSEYLIYEYTEWSPLFFYKLYPNLKLPLNLFELVILFNIATGHAISFRKQERVW